MVHVANYTEEELRDFIDQDTGEVGGTHPTTVPVTITVSAAICPTTKCTSKC
ncbi:class II lanthipeptide, LchA2/BrtA2 family [Corynebacterium phocae]|uniref:class II lanthipeptide, LchA2/BrtA2 family n=1 Tax=Corynebacterium phocae TaxID=161895 RepID=UPI001B80DBF9